MDNLEIMFGTDMRTLDSDGDGYGDFDEVMYGYDPMDPSKERKFKRKIVVDRSSQRLQYLVNGKVVLDVPVSTGVQSRVTPLGTFTIQKKIPVKRYVGTTYDYRNVKWNLQFKPQYYLHTAYWHNDFGIRPKSSGCVNMREADVELLYKYVDVGTTVEVIGKTPIIVAKQS